jgi:pyruvate dehydrogenase E2 component (dihydrolipoamide acetyltransferase)
MVSLARNLLLPQQGQIPRANTMARNDKFISLLTNNIDLLMPFSVVMPALEMGQETGKLVSWRRKEGDTVVKGEPLLEVETDKAVLEVEAPADGTLQRVTAHEGQVIPVGQTIAWIVGAGEILTVADEASPRTGVPASPAQAPSPQGASQETPKSGARISPKARRLAKEHGIDISTVKGTGADGEILASDIQALADSKTAAPDAAPVDAPLSATARLMAERTTQSWTTAPHFFLVRELDATPLIKAREKFASTFKDASGVKLTYTDLLVALVARTLEKHPRMNARWDGNEIRLNPKINIGIAMAVPDGVVVAVIPDANTLALADIASRRAEMTDRARSRKLRPADIANGTFTISNLGIYEVDAFTAIITPPQAAILAVGRIADRVVAVDGQPQVRPMLTLTLSSDHRVVGGAPAALFLQDLANAIREVMIRTDNLQL